MQLFQPVLCIREVHLIHHQQGGLGEQVLLVELQLLQNNTGGFHQSFRCSTVEKQHGEIRIQMKAAGSRGTMSLPTRCVVNASQCLRVNAVYV